MVSLSPVGSPPDQDNSKFSISASVVASSVKITVAFCCFTRQNPNRQMNRRSRLPIATTQCQDTTAFARRAFSLAYPPRSLLDDLWVASVRALATGFMLACASLANLYASGVDARANQFIGFDRFSAFEKSRGSKPGELVLTSPVIVGRINWDELIASWNADTPDGTYLKIEARALYPVSATKYYTMGLWSSNPTRYPRESVPRQKDDDGSVATDTLTLNRPSVHLQVRLTLGGDYMMLPKLKFLGLALTDTRTSPAPLPPNPAAWDRLLPVPERSQMKYPNGKVLCSPTTVSMLLGFWADKLNRPDLDHDVPEIADAIFDAKWKGTGNWAFNTAYAGAQRGMRAYVTRLSDVAELEEWIASGIPVGLSLDYDRLRGKGPGPNGHLVVLVGFTAKGDPIINDPGTSQNVRKTFPRKNLIYAWSYSRNAVYLVYPENSELPRDRFGHWDSWTAHLRIKHE